MAGAEAGLELIGGILSMKSELCVLEVHLIP
jgi:hypothetical protein